MVFCFLKVLAQELATTIPRGGILQDDGSFITPGGTSISNHGAKGNGKEYTDGKGWLPEEIDHIISDPTATATQKGRHGLKGKTIEVVFDEEGHWAKVDEDGNVIQVSDRNVDANDDNNDPGEIEDFEVKEEE